MGICSSKQDKELQQNKQWRNPVYSDDILVFAYRDIHDQDKSFWCYLDSPFEPISRNIKFSEELKNILQGQIVDTWRSIGQLIIHKHTYGFLLDLDGTNEIYDGGINQNWQLILQQRFFQQIFRKYAYFVLSEDEQEQNVIKKRGIIGTQDEQCIDPLLVPFEEQLFFHQKQEVNWMIKLEQNPVIKVQDNLDFIPLLDSGFYFDPSRPMFLMTKNQLNGKCYTMKGGILASQIGSGKTISVIALTCIGYQLKNDLSFFQQINQQKMWKPVNPLIDDLYDDQIQKKLEQKEKFLPSLVVVTKNILYQWKEQYDKFTRNCLKVGVFDNYQKLLKYKQDKKIFDVILTDRDTLLDLFIHDKQYKSQIFNLNLERIIFDEIHEITQIYSANKSLNQQNAKQKNIENKFQNNIFLFYDCINKIQQNCNFTWGITGTIENLSYTENTESLGKLLNLDRNYYNNIYYDKLKDAFAEYSIRGNSRSTFLPELQQDIIQVYFGNIQNLLYRGKLLNLKNEKEIKELCSHLTKQFEFINELGQNDNQYANMTNQIKNIIQKQIQDIYKQIAENENEQMKKNLEEKLQIMINEDSFYHQVLEGLQKQDFKFEIQNVSNGIEIKQNNDLELYVAQENQLKVGILSPYLKLGNKFSFKFEVQGLTSQKMFGFGLQKLEQNEIQIEKVSQNIVFKDNKLCNEKGLKYDGCILGGNINLMRQEYIYEFQFKIKNKLGNKKLYYGLIENCPGQDLENCNEKTIQNLKGILFDGNVVCIINNKIITTLNQIFLENGDVIQLTADLQKQLFIVKNLSKNQQEYINLQLIIDNNDQQSSNIFNFGVFLQKRDHIEVLSLKQKLSLDSQFFLDEMKNIANKKQLENYLIIQANGQISNFGQQLQNQDGFQIENNDLVQIDIDLNDKQFFIQNLNTKKQLQINFGVRNNQNQRDDLSLAVFLGHKEDQVKIIEQNNNFECPICMEEFSKNQMVLTECMHQVCINCYDLLVKQMLPQCPYCKYQIEQNNVLIHPKFNKYQKDKNTKIDQLYEMIIKTPKDDKVIIFTQFDNLVHKLEKEFYKKNLEFCTLKGEPSDINIRLQKFKKIPSIKVLIMSIEQAASGIDVQQANHIFFVHPLFLSLDQAKITYQQCIGRAYRVGQTKQVKVYLMVTQASIEEEYQQGFKMVNFKFSNAN